MNAILEHFEYEHLPPHLQEMSKPFCELARQLDTTLKDGPEKSAGLRKLLEAKDCFVRQLRVDIKSTVATKSLNATITLNGHIIVTTPQLSYERIVELADLPPGRVYSMTYIKRQAGDSTRSGILSPGQTLVEVDGMKISVADTSSA